MKYNSRLIFKVEQQDIVCFLLAILPISASYKFFDFNIGLGTALIGIFSIYSVLSILSSKTIIIPLFILVQYCYFIIRKLGYYTDITLLLASLISMFTICQGKINHSKLRNIIEIIALINSFLLFIQVFFHYIAGVNINYIIINWLNESSQVGSNTGSLYRPSALFLEPAHFAQYCSIALLSTLFPITGKRVKYVRAFLISAGILLTTSGIGIVLSVGILGWYILFTKRKNGSKIIYLFFGILSATIAGIILYQIPFIKLSITRIFGKVDGYNALSGRLWAWNVTIKKMTGHTLIFGYGTDRFFDGYLTGLMQIIMNYGIIGLILLILSFLYAINKNHNNFIFLGSIIYLGLIIVADVVSVYSMVFYTGIIYTGIMDKKQNIIKTTVLNQLVEI